MPAPRGMACQHLWTFIFSEIINVFCFHQKSSFTKYNQHFLYKYQESQRQVENRCLSWAQNTKKYFLIISITNFLIRYWSTFCLIMNTEQNYLKDWKRLLTGTVSKCFPTDQQNHNPTDLISHHRLSLFASLMILSNVVLDTTFTRMCDVCVLTGMLLWCCQNEDNF